MTTVRCSSGSGSCEALTTGSAAACSDVVAVHRDIDHPGRDAHLFDRLDVGRDAPRQLDAARRDADQNERGKVGIALDDFVRDPPQGTRIASASKMRTASDSLVGRVLFIFLCDLAGSP